MKSVTGLSNQLRSYLKIRDGSNLRIELGLPLGSRPEIELEFFSRLKASVLNISSNVAGQNNIIFVLL